MTTAPVVAVGYIRQTIAPSTRILINGAKVGKRSRGKTIFFHLRNIIHDIDLFFAFSYFCTNL